MNVGEKIYSNNTKQTYTVFQTLKAGGQSEACFATSDKSKKIFFIKRFLNVKYSDKPKLKDKCQKFEEERRRIYKSINSNTLSGGACSYIYDFFRENTFYYVVTEKIDGIELDTRLLSRAFPIEEKLFIFRIMVYSFLPLEKARIIHADVKPENFLLRNTGERYVSKLIDFESAFHVETPPEKGFVVGTEPYYSPELAVYNSENNAVEASALSTRSDIFSLGIILYEFLTGNYPVPKECGKYAFELIRDGGCIKMDPSWSPALCSLIRDMLSLSSKCRPSVEVVTERLKKILDVSIPPATIVAPSVMIQRVSERSAHVSILTLNKNVEIFYNMDCNGWIKYESPFLLNDDDVELGVQVVMHKEDGILEEMKYPHMISVSTNRKVKMPRPVIKICDGLVAMECSKDDAVIHYTVDGTSPTKKSPIFLNSFHVGSNVTVKAFSRCIGFLPSDMVSVNSSSKVRFS